MSSWAHLGSPLNHHVLILLFNMKTIPKQELYKVGFSQKQEREKDNILTDLRF